MDEKKLFEDKMTLPLWIKEHNLKERMNVINNDCFSLYVDDDMAINFWDGLRRGHSASETKEDLEGIFE